MARRFSVIQGGLTDAPRATPGRSSSDAVAERIGLQRPAAAGTRPPIPAEAILGIRPKGWAPEAA